jgi:hypothetical protein
MMSFSGFPVCHIPVDFSFLSVGADRHRPQYRDLILDDFLECDKEVAHDAWTRK